MVPSIYIPGTTPHCLVSTEGNVNFLGTRNLVYTACCGCDDYHKPRGNILIIIFSFQLYCLVIKVLSAKYFGMINISFR